MAQNSKTDDVPNFIDSRDLPSNGGDLEVPEGTPSRPSVTEVEGTGSTGGVGTGDQTGEVSGDLTTGPAE